MIAALYVLADGIYSERPNVDLWPESRDARKYAGPHPVIAHPPCARWAYTLAPLNERRYGHRVGDDGGCFAAALTSLLTWGGVLEHPALSLAWAAHKIAKPVKGRWLRTGPRCWTCQVSQCAYGHPARKRTWLLYSGDKPPFDLDWGEPPHRARVSQDRVSVRTAGTSPSLSKKAGLATPPAFAEILHRLALWSRYAHSI